MPLLTRVFCYDSECVALRLFVRLERFNFSSRSLPVGFDELFQRVRLMPIVKRPKGRIFDPHHPRTKLAAQVRYLFPLGTRGGITVLVIL